MSGFNSPVVGGQATLIREAIKSPNFVQNVSGWSINKDGSAQFNNLTITSGTLNGLNYYIDKTGAFFYNGTPAANKLSASIVPGSVNIADKFGNVCLPGFTTYQDTGTVFIAFNIPGAGAQSGFILYSSSPAHNETSGWGVILADMIVDASGNVSLSGNSFGWNGSGINGATSVSYVNPGFVTIKAGGLGSPFGGMAINPGATTTQTLLIAPSGGTATFGTFVDVEGSFGIAGNAVISGFWQLQNQSGSPASVTGASLLWSDQFTQLRTDRAFVSMVNFEPANQGSPPGPGGSGGKLYSQNGHLQARSGQTGTGGDTLSYDMETLTHDLPNDSASLTNTVDALFGIAGFNVQAQKYRLYACIYVKQGAAAGTVDVAFHGPAVASGGTGGHASDNANTLNVNQTGGLVTSTKLMTNIGRTTKFVLEGVVTFSAASLLSVQAATSNAADPYVVQAGSYMQISPIQAT